MTAVVRGAGARSAEPERRGADVEAAAEPEPEAAPSRGSVAEEAPAAPAAEEKPKRRSLRKKKDES